jgi:hypothetical protein
LTLYASYTIPEQYLPNREVLSLVHPEMELPDEYSGKSNNHQLAEIFFQSIKKGRTWKNIEILELETTQEQLYDALVKFYAPQCSYIIFYSFSSLTHEVELSETSIINCLYLAHYYGVNSSIIVLSTLSALAKSPIIQLDTKTCVPSKQEIDSYNTVLTWMKNENLTAPIDVIWFVSQHWSPEILLDTLVNGGRMQDIIKLLVVGFRDPEEIRQQLTGEDAMLPESWMKDLMDITGYEKTI